MKLFLDYLQERKNIYCLFILCGLIIMGVFYLYYLSWEPLFYAFFLCFVFLCIASLGDFIKYSKKRKALENIKKDIPYLSCYPSSHSPLIHDYQDIISSLIQSIHDNQHTYESDISDMLDYYTLWVHQIKLPISAMHLLLQQEDNSLTFQLSAELLKIEQYVDMVLSYLRLKSQSTDYVIKEYDLDDIIKESIRKLSTLFIEKHIMIDFQETHQKVLTDRKWLIFVLEQLLSNAIKYTHKGKVSIYYDYQRLIIEDTGEGIEASDLKRIFEKGFTGFNGREYEKSSGLGLYLCDKILKNLSHHIEIQSKRYVGTKVILDFTYKKRVIE
jgi:Signal transduction histidine kinase